ncbi:hypothetical protein FBR02_07080 [Anaerolineae bacterium CFX9]|jgi:hypothetical protein|nr:hypothetical protein [Anaerolineae bacterium CFX9]
MQQIDWQKILPVLISIGIIIVVAVLRNQSRTIAAIAATMPINIPLAIWIFSAGTAPNDQDGLVHFIESMMIGLIPGMIFLFVAYFAARAGWGTLPIILVGYLAWAISLGIGLLIQSLLRR